MPITMKTTAIALAGLVSAAASFAPTAIAQAVSKIGNVTYSISSSSQVPNAFISFTASDARYKVMMYPAMSTIFHGPCSEVVTIQILLQNDPKLNLDVFRASRSSRDLPIQELLQVSGRVLAEHCRGLQVVRVKIENFGYEGTLTRDNGWAVKDGYVTTAADAIARFELRVEDSTGNLRVLHVGSCEAEPKLLMEPLRPAATSRRDNLMYQYTALAKNAAFKYAQQCRSVKRVSFALALMPSSFLCANGDECFMEATIEEQQWKANLNQFAAKNYTYPIRDFNDVAEVLLAGAFDVLKADQLLTKYFVWSYFVKFQEVCRDHIRKPVRRTTRWTTVKRDSYGTVINEETREYSTVVESEYAWAYDANEHAQRLYAGRTLMREITKGGPVDAFTKYNLATVGTLFQDMQSLLEGNCTSDRVVAMQQNMLNYVGGKAPIIGSYTTAKKPETIYPDVMMSAPQFTATYIAERAQRMGATAQVQTMPATAPTEVARSNPSGPAAAQQGAPTVPGVGQDGSADVHKQYAEALVKLEQDHQAQLQSAGALQRLKLEAEFKYKKMLLERDYRNKLKSAQQR